MWRIKFDGEVYREADLTIGQAEDIEREAGITWLQMDPLRSAKTARSVLTICIRDRTGVTIDEAREKSRALRIEKFELEPDEDDLPEVFENGFPPVAAEPSTAT
jgi:hypothetical protein